MTIYLSIFLSLVYDCNKTLGDWTRKFAKRLGCQFDENKLGTWNPWLIGTIRPQRYLPYIMVDGAFGSTIQNALDYDVSVFIGAGVGVV